MTKLVLALLAISLVSLQTPTCEAQFVFDFDFIKNALSVKNFIQTGIDFVKWITAPKEAIEDENNSSKLIEKISENVESIKSALKGNFTEILARIDKIPGISLEVDVKLSFQKVVDHVVDAFKILAGKQIKNNKNMSWISQTEGTVAANYETNLERDWSEVEQYLFNRNIIKYMKMKESNNVCETGLSHMQLLENSMVQYLSVATQYMLSRHIIYNIREYVDKQSMDGDRHTFNENLQKTLQESVNKFKEAMKGCSTEFWLCDPQGQKPSDTKYIQEVREDYAMVPTSSCQDKLNEGYQCIPTNNKKCDCIKSTMNVSLLMAQADPGYVIVGVNLAKNLDQLWINATQAKLLPNGQIDGNTIRPTTKEKKSGKSSWADFVIKKSEMLHGGVVLSERDNRFITAVGFQKSNEQIFHLAAESMKYDFKKNQFVQRSERNEGFSRVQNTGTKFLRIADGKAPNLRWTDRISPLVDTRLVQSSSPSPLSGVSLFLRGESEKNGFLAIKINTYNVVPHIPQIPQLNDYPVKEVLKSLSDKATLKELSQRYE